MKIIDHKFVKNGAVEDGHFNGGDHVFIEVEAGAHQTVSCKLPNGKFVTFAFMPGTGAEFECVDIHSTVGKHWTDEQTLGRNHWQQQAVGFSKGNNTFDTRKVQTPTSLITLLLASGHHRNAKD